MAGRLIILATFLGFLLGAHQAGANSLTTVKPLERFAFSAVGVVKTFGPGSVVLCSGTLVAQDLVVTSAHCLEKYKGLLQHVDFAAGQTGTRALAVSGAAEIIQHPVWSYASGPARLSYDVAVVRLARPIPEERVRSIELLPDDVDMPSEAALLAYKAAREQFLHGRFDCGLAPANSIGLFESDCSVSGGNSGGAVLVQSGDDWKLAGVILASASRDKSTLVVSVDQWLRDHVEDALRREAKRTARAE